MATTANAATTKKNGGADSPRATLPRMNALIEWGILRKGDRLYIKRFPDRVATVVDDDLIEVDGKRVGYNEWGKQVTGWSAIDVYEWIVLERAGRTLDELRRAEMHRRNAIADSVSGDEAPELAPAAPNGAVPVPPE